VKNTTKTISIT